MKVQMDLFSYEYQEQGMRDPKNYAPGYEYMAFMEGSTNRIEAMQTYRAYILKEIAKAETEEKKKQWENALQSIERQIEDFNDKNTNDEV